MLRVGRSASTLLRTVRPSSSHVGLRAFASGLGRREEEEGGEGDQSAREKKKVSPSEFRKLLGLAKPEAKPLLGAVGLLGVSTSITMGVPYGMGRIIDLVSNGTTVETLLQIGGGLSALFAVGAVANFSRTYLIRTSGERIITKIRNDLFQSIMRQEMDFFDKNRTGELINRLSSDTTVVAKSLTMNLSDGLRSVIGATVGASMMLYMSPKLTLVMLTIIPPAALAAAYYGRYIKRLSRQTQDALSAANKVAEERLGSIRTVRAFAQEDHEALRYHDEVAVVLRLARNEAIASGSFFGAMSFMGNMVVIGVLLTGGHMVMASELTMGALTSFLLYTGYVGSSVAGLSSFYSEIQKGLGATHRIFELLERPPAIPLKGGRILEHVEGRINFRDVTFSYPSRAGVPIFQGFNLTVDSGTAIAVVGESGSGKSTVAALLLRFYDPQQGQITLDDVDIRLLDPHWLRAQIGIVNQEPSLFAATIFDNIAYAKPTATREEVLWAAKRANAHRFIEKFSQGYETYVGERGVALSGGQKQRIAIARAILKDPKILILDEATSALDAESEQLVQDALEKLMSGRTVITIAHRLSTIKAANYVSVIADGRVVEFDTHERLLTIQNGYFKRLMDRQIGGLLLPSSVAASSPPSPSPSSPSSPS